MFHTLTNLSLYKLSISNIQKLIDTGRVLSHKKYQMMNQLYFNQPHQQSNEVIVKKHL
jgi:hypothetical protein